MILHTLSGRSTRILASVGLLLVAIAGRSAADDGYAGPGSITGHVTVEIRDAGGAIDFALAPGGRITGRITDAADGHSLDAGVTAFDASGNWLAGEGAPARPPAEAGRAREDAGQTVIAVPAMTGGWARPVVVPVTLQAQGIENAAGFSVTFDTSRLTFVSAALGSNVASASLNVNALAAGSGRVGLAMALSSGQTMPAGTYPLVLLTFQSAAGSGTATTAIGFGDDPVIREVSDAQANVVAATFQGATITLAPLPTFTDDPVQPRVTPVNAAHIMEMRQRIGELRARFGLGPFAWTDPALTVRVTPAKAPHLIELRAALAAAYSAAGRTVPVWSEAAIVAGTTVITAAQMTELRAAILAIW